MYKDQVIQIAGGLNDFIGVLDQTPHKMGKDWYRINDPCLYFQRENQAMKKLENVVVFMPGLNKTYKRYVDIRIPPDMPMEIRTVDKDGELYKVYRQEVDRQPSRIITLPNTSIN